MIQSILYGNGINLLTKGMPSWDGLISGLFGTNLGSQIPNPLKYEALLMNKRYRKPSHPLYDCDGQPILTIDESKLYVLGEYTEKALLDKIVNRLSSLTTTNRIYDAISELPVSHLITTNYDNSFFQSIGGEMVIKSKVVSEKKYSIKRNYVIDNHKIGLQHYWPIHGNIDSPSSIMLGYDHYCNSLSKIAYYARGGENLKGKRVDSIEQRLKEGISNPIAWVDLFFISDVHIIGLGLNYDEMDLWWVLNKRRRTKWEDPKLINNKIFYYQVGKLTDSQNKVFSSFDINVEPLTPELLNMNDYMPRYESQIEVMKRNIHKRHGRTL